MFGKVVLALSVLLLAAENTWAYTGPGADIAFLSYALTLLVWVLTLFSALLLWPVYALLRKIRSPNPQAKPEGREPKQNLGARMDISIIDISPKESSLE